MLQVLEEYPIKETYDEEHDVMYINTVPCMGIAEEIVHGVYLRMNEETMQVVGLTIMDYSKRESIDKWLKYIGKKQYIEYR